MSIKPPECWAIDPQASGLRIEVTPTKVLLLPFDQFLFAELTAEDMEQRLEINFATHQVLIHGQNLRRIEIAMQRMELSLITKVSTNYQILENSGQPLILKIVVVENTSPCSKVTQA